MINWIEATQDNFIKYDLMKKVEDNLVGFLIFNPTTENNTIVCGSQYWDNLNFEKEKIRMTDGNGWDYTIETDNIVITYSDSCSNEVTHFALKSEIDSILPKINQ